MPFRYFVRSTNGLAHDLYSLHVPPLPPHTFCSSALLGLCSSDRCLLPSPSALVYSLHSGISLSSICDMSVIWCPAAKHQGKLNLRQTIFFCVPCIRCSSGGNRQNCGIFLRQRFRRSDCSSHRGTLKFICTPHIRWPGGILGAEFVSVKSIFFANLCRKVAIIVYPLPRNLQYVLVFR